MSGGAPTWENPDARTWVLQLEEGGDWVEVKRFEGDATPSWRVDARLAGSHYKLRDAFATKELAQGSALLLAMRMLPSSRAALHAHLDAVPGAWWWKISPSDDAADDHRAVVASRLAGSEEDAERSGRAAGAGWWLHVYGPGCVRALGRLPR